MLTKRDWINISILALVGIVTHLNWFNPTSVINFSDWLYFPDKTVSELWFSWGAWNSFWNLGHSNLQISFFPFKLIWSIIALLGLSYDTATKLTFFIPIALLGFVSPYVLSKKLFKSSAISFVLSVYYGSTTYFIIKQIAHIPIAFVYALAPLVLYLFIQAVDKKKLIPWLTFSLFLSLITWYEVRITFIVVGILFLYFLIFCISDFKKYIKYIVISTIVFIGLNVFWIMPTTLTSVSSSISTLTERGMFGDFLFDMQHAFTLTEASWTGGVPNMEFIKQEVPWHFWIIPIISLLPTLIFKIYTQHDRKKILFFLILLITGILLTKQSAPPFEWLYSFLFNNISVFQLYREASKFYLITALGFFGLLGFAMQYGEKALQSINIHIKHANLLISLLIICISCINLYPLITHKFEATFKSHPIPEAFEVLNDTIQHDSSFYRTLWLDTCCQYIAFNYSHPRATGSEYIPTLNNMLQIDDYGMNLTEKYMQFFNDPRSQPSLEVTAIKYIVIPIDPSMSTDVQENNTIIKSLQSREYLTKSTLSNSSLVIFENEEYVPHIYLTALPLNLAKETSSIPISYNTATPSRHHITFNHISEKMYLQFSETFHTDWKLHIGPFRWYALVQNDNALDNTFHVKNELNLNEYIIDPEFIKKNIDKNNYTLHKDGSISFEATLFFAPQLHFYIGLIISVLTMLIIILILTFNRLSNFKK